MTRQLITGANGLLGIALTHHLLGGGHEVIAAARDAGRASTLPRGVAGYRLVDGSPISMGVELDEVARWWHARKEGTA